MDNQYFDPPELNPVSEVIIFLMSLCGLGLNVIVLYIIQFRKQQTLGADTVLMTLVGLFDIIACFFAFILQIIRWNHGLSLYNSPTWCWFDLIFFSTSTYASLLITAQLSVIRYLVIVRKWKITWKTSLILSLLLIIILWVILVTRGSLNLLNTMPSGLYCMPFHYNYHTNNLIMLEIFYIGYLFPLPGFIIIGYILVTFHYCDLVNKGASEAASQANFGYCSSMARLVGDQFRRSHRYKTMKLIIMVLLYTIAILPEYVMTLLMLVIEFNRTSNLDCFAFLSMFSLCLINPLFVLNVHEHSREDFQEILATLRWR